MLPWYPKLIDGRLTLDRVIVLDPVIHLSGAISVHDVTKLVSNAGMRLLEFSLVFIVVVDSHAHGYK